MGLRRALLFYFVPSFTANSMSARLIQLRRKVNTMVAAAPWRGALLDHIAQMESSATFVLGSLSAAPPPSPHFEARARTVVYRGLWAELPANPKNKAELNPEAYNTDLPTITTDVRMHKVADMFPDPAAGPGGQSAIGGSVEAVFWCAQAKTQWRLQGHACMIGPDIDSDAAAPVREALAPYMRPRDESTKAWRWSRELTAQFGNLSPAMRGTFRNPPPGTPITEKPAEGLGLGQEVEDLHDSISRSNFRVVVIVPEEVDRVDLTNPKRGRRWNYRLVSGTWKETELWP